MLKVVTEAQGGVLFIRLNRPEKRNAIDDEMARGLDAALTQLESDHALRVGVLSGTTAVFSAGTDLAAPATPTTELGGEYGIVRRERTKPLIAAVEGPALGGGMEIVLACELVVASTTARFGLPEVLRGVVANCGALFRGHRALPANLCNQLLLTGQPIDAEVARTVQLVNVLTPPGEAVAAATELATQICRASPAAIAATLAAIGDARRDAETAGWRATALAVEQAGASDDWAEGVAAFLEKRPPRWS